MSQAEPRSESVMATAPATPLPERDATVSDSISSQDRNLHAGAAEGSTSMSPQSQHEDPEGLSGVQWFYRDPGGQEQGIYLSSFLEVMLNFSQDLSQAARCMTGIHIHISRTTFHCDAIPKMYFIPWQSSRPPLAV